MSDRTVLLGLGAFVAYCLFLFPVACWIHYTNDRDFDALKRRAMASGDLAEMLEYTEKYKGNLESQELTQGHFAIIFHTPVNDYALHYQSISRLVEKLKALQDLDSSSLAYQKALDNSRGIIGSLESVAEGKTRVEIRWLLVVFCIILTFVIVTAMRPSR